MALVAPVNLAYNVRTLWFDPEGLDLHAGDQVVVETARGLELGVCAGDVMEVPYEDIQKLKSPLKPVRRVATEEDVERGREMEQLSREAMPIFREMARETSEEMHPVSVEYLLDGDKAVFYFESEARIDFRELVRKLAARFHVRIDMRQIGVRDEARIVGGIAHCGQMVCCKRLGGEFNPVSIRMAKDQDLSLNPQKISGLCGRLMCCLRYENDAYRDFKQRAPKVRAAVQTPEGEGKVVELDVPREMVVVRVGDEKPVRVPLAGFEPAEEGKRPNVVSEEAWEDAKGAVDALFGAAASFETSKFTGNDTLAVAGQLHRANPDSGKSKGALGSSASSHRKPRKRGGRGGSGGGSQQQASSKTDATRKPRRRRSTKISGGEAQPAQDAGSKRQQPKRRPKQDQNRQKQGGKGAEQQKQGLRPGHKSSSLAHAEGAPEKQGAPKKRRRRRRKSGSGGEGGGQASAAPKGGEQ